VGSAHPTGTTRLKMWVKRSPNILLIVFFSALNAHSFSRVVPLLASWKEEGRESATRGLVIKLLTRKLGNLSPELLARVNGLNLDRVEALAEDLLDFTSVGDLERWLAA
jgi:Domain of unknown function (DUF4351)